MILLLDLSLLTVIGVIRAWNIPRLSPGRGRILNHLLIIEILRKILRRCRRRRIGRIGLPGRSPRTEMAEAKWGREVFLKNRRINRQNGAHSLDLQTRNRAKLFYRPITRPLGRLKPQNKAARVAKAGPWPTKRGVRWPKSPREPPNKGHIMKEKIPNQCPLPENSNRDPPPTTSKMP